MCFLKAKFNNWLFWGAFWGWVLDERPREKDPRGFAKDFEGLKSESMIELWEILSGGSIG